MSAFVFTRCKVRFDGMPAGVWAAILARDVCRGWET